MKNILRKLFFLEPINDSEVSKQIWQISGAEWNFPTFLGFLLGIGLLGLCSILNIRLNYFADVLVLLGSLGIVLIFFAKKN